MDTILWKVAPASPNSEEAASGAPASPNSEGAASGAGKCPDSGLKTAFAVAGECPNSDLSNTVIADLEQLFGDVYQECAEADAAACEEAQAKQFENELLMQKGVVWLTNKELLEKVTSVSALSTAAPMPRKLPSVSAK